MVHLLDFGSNSGASNIEWIVIAGFLGAALAWTAACGTGSCFVFLGIGTSCTVLRNLK